MRTSKVKSQKVAHRWTRFALFLFGLINVMLGMVSVFVPGLPTTMFLLIALWAFSISSVRFHSWLWNHPRFVRSIRNWNEHRNISVKVKFLAVFMMSGSFLYLMFFILESWVLATLIAAIMLPSGSYVITHNSRIR
jgi:uncharacterized membrane protein YbaN (DUF454 family)